MKNSTVATWWCVYWAIIAVASAMLWRSPITVGFLVLLSVEAWWFHRLGPSRRGIVAWLVALVTIFLFLWVHSPQVR